MVTVSGGHDRIQLVNRLVGLSVCGCGGSEGWEGYIYQVGPQGGHRLGRGGARTALVLQTVLALALLVQARDRASPGHPAGGGGSRLTVGKSR